MTHTTRDWESLFTAPFLIAASWSTRQFRLYNLRVRTCLSTWNTNPAHVRVQGFCNNLRISASSTRSKKCLQWLCLHTPYNNCCEIVEYHDQTRHCYFWENAQHCSGGKINRCQKDLQRVPSCNRTSYDLDTRKSCLRNKLYQDRLKSTECFAFVHTKDDDATWKVSLKSSNIRNVGKG